MVYFEIDRIALQAKRESIIARKAKTNSGTRTDLSAKLPEGSPIDTRKLSAKAAGVGERTYDAGIGTTNPPPPRTR